MNGMGEVKNYPSWQDVVDFLGQLAPNNEITLTDQDGASLKAMGGRLKFLIYFKTKDSSSYALIVGRRKGQKRRGYATINGALVMATPWEYWSSQDGLDVFKQFYTNQTLGFSYALRDFAVRHTKEEIINLIES
jgi:hypothetical protein